MVRSACSGFGGAGGQFFAEPWTFLLKTQELFQLSTKA